MGKKNKKKNNDAGEPGAAEQNLSVRDLLRVGPDFQLSAVDPRRIVAGPADKAEARAAAAALEGEVTEWQERLFAESKGGGQRRLLIVLQGMDTSGKGGAAKAIDRISEPIGLRMRSFGPPTREEKRRHFLWRINRALPPVGSIGIFDRSHYEDVLVVRVDSLVPESEWRWREIGRAHV